METSIIKIGNSRGLIIPKKMLNTFGENKTVDIQVANGSLVIKPLVETRARNNWEKQFTEAIAKGFVPDENVIEIENEFDKEEWTW